MTDGPVEHDLELTVSALKDGVLDLGLPGGLIEVRRWEDALAGSDAPALTEIGAGLAELRGELESDQPDTGAVSALLLSLGGRTLAIAETLDPGTPGRGWSSWATCWSGKARSCRRSSGRSLPAGAGRGALLSPPSSPAGAGRGQPC